MGVAQRARACLACAESRMCCAHILASLAVTWQVDAGGSEVQGQPDSKEGKIIKIEKEKGSLLEDGIYFGFVLLLL